MPYDITVLEYARSPRHPVSGVYYGRHNAGTMNLPFAYALLSSDKEVILVDCGYDAADFGGEIASSIGVTGWHSPAEVLGTVGISPDEVGHLFLTHGHFDHIGAVAHFPNARVYVQRKEFESWLWAMGKGPRYRFLMGGVNPEDIFRLVRLGLEGRLVLLDGSQEEVLPGVDVVLAQDTHTAGCQYVVVRNGPSEDEKWVLSGDLIYTYENLNGGDVDNPFFLPPGLATGSQTRLVEVADEMLAAAGGRSDRIVPVHEERLSELFPSEISNLGLHIVKVFQNTASSGERA